MKKIIAIAMTMVLLLSMPVCTYAKDTIYNYSAGAGESEYYYSVSVTNNNIKDGKQYVLMVISSGTSVSNISEDTIQQLDQAEAENNQVSFELFCPKTYGQHDVYIAGSGFSEPLKTGTLESPPGFISGKISFKGSAAAGKTITVDTTGITSENPGKITCKWYRDNILIENAVTDSYTVSSEDVGKTIRVEVTAANYDGSLNAEITAKSADSGGGGGGGGGGGAAETKIAVSVAKTINGKIDVETSSPKNGKLVSFTVVPNDGYNTKNVIVKDTKGKIIEVLQNGNNYSFIMPNDSVTISAEFENKNDTLSFVDVESGDWFYNSVIYAYSKGIMNGVTESEFAPNKETTRGMLVTMLYRLENKPEVTGVNKFADVKETAYYRDAVVWASSNGIVTGYSENTFGPENNITREQIATILYRYAEFKGIDISKGTLENLNEFSDADRVSSWAVKSMKWACGNQLINGMGNNALASKGAATRAQVATLLMRFIENLSK